MAFWLGVVAAAAVPTSMQPADPLESVGLAAVRLQETEYGTGRFRPTNQDELYASIFTLWNVLDATMRTHDPKRYQAGYVREIQLRKMMQLVSRPTIKNYCEIGMNGGHATAAMLTANPDLVAHVFDMLDFNYSKPVAAFLSTVFGERFVLHSGNTHAVLRGWARSFSRRCDLMFIDGDHSRAGAKQDMLEMAVAAAPGAALVVDDLATGPGEALTELASAEAPLLTVPEQYGPYAPNSTHNPCLRTQAGPLCIAWGFAVARYRDYTRLPAPKPSVEP